MYLISEGDPCASALSRKPTEKGMRFSNRIPYVPIGSGKCHGVEVALRYFGISWDEVFAFDDGDNDYEMLKRAGNDRENIVGGRLILTLGELQSEPGGTAADKLQSIP